MRFWTADLHLGHGRILELCPERPWATLAAMNEGLIERWNEVVGPEDEVWVVGDFALGRIQETLQLVPRLQGRKVLFPGNHDRCSPAYPHRRDDLDKWQARYLEAGFQRIEPPGRHRLGQVLCEISHFPYREAEDPHYGGLLDPFRPRDQGLPLIHGHVHGAWRTRGRMINVGVDVWDFRPVPEALLASLLAGNPGGLSP